LLRRVCATVRQDNELFRWAKMAVKREELAILN
jgi:hypothetical protein